MFEVHCSIFASVWLRFRRLAAKVITGKRLAPKPWILAAQRRGIADIAFVELDIFLGEIGAVNYGAGLAEIQVNVQVEFLKCDGGAEFFEAGLGRLAALEAPEDFAAAGSAVADVHPFLDDFGGRVPQRVDDAAPIRIPAVPTRFYERAVRHGAGGGVGLWRIARAAQAHGDKA